MSTFSAEQFMQGSVTDAHDTVVPRVPDGIYLAQVNKLDFRTLEANGDNPERTIMEVTWNILDEKVAKLTGIANPIVRQSIWLDLDAQGKLLTTSGKNVGLGRLRDALGQNKAGKPWAPNMLVGGSARVSVKGILNKKDGETYSQVDKVTKA